MPRVCLCAFGSLYANVNSRGEKGGPNISGVWRLTDTDGDDQYDKKEHMLPLNGGSEHGPHAMILTPDGKRIVLCAGNNTDLPADIARSRVPRNWDEDHLLGRMPDARGHNASRLGPGGFILSMNPDGERRGVDRNRVPQRVRHRASIATANCSPTMPTWNGMSERLGIDRRGSIT